MNSVTFTLAAPEARSVTLLISDDGGCSPQPVPLTGTGYNLGLDSAADVCAAGSALHRAKFAPFRTAALEPRERIERRPTRQA
jgi:hypothetical protein